MTKPVLYVFVVFDLDRLVKQHRLFHSHGCGLFFVWLGTTKTRLGLGTDHGFGRNNFLKTSSLALA